MTRAPRHRHLLVLAAFVFLAASCEVADPAPGETIAAPVTAMQKVLDDVHYGPDGHEVLDVYTPPNVNGGAILWIHGGGWADGDGDPNSLATEEANGMQPAVQELYRRGWTVFSMRYAGTDEAIFPDQIYDAKLAIRWVKVHAAEFGVSSESVVAMGWSSGGHLAALLGMSSGSLEPPSPPAELAAVSSRPAAVVSISGVLDPATFPYVPGLPPGNGQGIASLIGCPATPSQWQTCNPQLLEAARPTNYDDAGDPPIYIAQGDRDGIVDPYWQALVPYQQFVSTMGNGAVWLDMVDTGDPASYGGEDPRNHTKALSYELNMSALAGFVDRALPAVPPRGTVAQFVPLTPCRLGDTRAANSFQRLAAGSYRVQVAGRCGVPAGATSVAATVTIVRPAGGGAVSVSPASAPTGLPLLPFNAGEVRANSGMVSLSAAGAIDLSGVSGAVIVDVTGAFVPAPTATSGRYVAITPTRVLDSRAAGGAAPGGGSVTVLDPTAAGVPADAAAVAVNLTAVQASGAGYLTAMAAGGAPPVASALNVDSSGQTRGGFVVVPLAGGRFSVVQSMQAHLVVDVVGYFTGASAPRSQAGLYLAFPARRAFDSRQSAAFEPLVERTVAIADGRAAAVVSTIQLLGGTGGYAAAWPTGTATPTVASVNADPTGRPVANQAFIGVTGGAAQVVSSSAAHVIIDVEGEFLAG